MPRVTSKRLRKVAVVVSRACVASSVRGRVGSSPPSFQCCSSRPAIRCQFRASHRDADVNLGISRSGTVTLDLRLGGQPSREQLTSIGQDASTVFATDDVVVTTDDEGAGEFVKVIAPSAYTRGRDAEFEIDLSPLAQVLDDHGYRNVRLLLIAPRIPTIIRGSPPPTDPSEYSALWEPDGAFVGPVVDVAMSPEPADFWTLVAGLIAALIANITTAGILLARQQRDSTRLRKTGTWFVAIAIIASGAAAFSRPFDHVDDLGVANIASGSALTTANVVAASSFPLAVVSLWLLLRSTRRRVPLPPPALLPASSGQRHADPSAPPSRTLTADRPPG